MTGPAWAFRARRVARRVAVLVLAALLASPAALFAHARLTRSVPAAGAELGVSPERVTLWFSEAPELAFSRIVLLGPDSTPVPLGEITHPPGAPLAITVRLSSALRPGRYTVVWQTAAADGHPTRGRFSFSVLPARGDATGAAPAPLIGPAQAPRPNVPEPARDSTARGEARTPFDADAPASVAVRWLSFVALLAIVGVSAFRWIVLPGAARLASRHARGADMEAVSVVALGRAARVGLVASVVVLVTALGRLLLEWLAMRDAAGAWGARGMMAMLVGTAWGVAWLVQATAAAVALAGFALARTRARSGSGTSWRDRSAPWRAAALAAIALALTPGMGGHAAAAPRLAPLSIVADGLHVLGAGGWLGTLLVIALVGIPVALGADSAERGGLVADLVNAFSPAALAFVGMLVATGTVAAWIHVGSVDALWRSAYGRLLLLKLAVFLPVLATGAHNWRRVRPRLGEVEGARAMRRSATVELVVGALVLAVTALLVATPTATDAIATLP